MDKKIFSVLFFSIFSAILGVGIVVPFLPVYAHDLGASGVYIALIFGAFSLSRAFFLPYFGRLSDIKGRKPFIMSGLLIYALVSIAFFFSEDINSLIIIRFIQGIGSAMVLPVTHAYIGEITPPGREGFAMGLFNISLYGGLSLGPLAGGIIKDRFNIQVTFGFMGIFALIALILCISMLPSRSSEKHSLRRGKPQTYRNLLKDKLITSLFIFRMCYTTCIGIVWSFLPVLADGEFALSSFLIGVLVMIGVLISGLLQTPMGYLADRVDKRNLIIIGGLLTAVAIFSLEFANGFWDMLFSNIAYGLGGGIAMPALMAISVVKGNQMGSMGSIMALLTLGHTIGMFSGSLFAGIMMDLFGLHVVFYSGAIIMLLGVGIFYTLMMREEIN
ncbi:MAG: MFS transporter [Spirochaetota bacterium]|nr:MFS transporter [Spirochaetota bacterium]